MRCRFEWSPASELFRHSPSPCPPGMACDTAATEHHNPALQTSPNNTLLLHN